VPHAPLTPVGTVNMWAVSDDTAERWHAVPLLLHTVMTELRMHRIAVKFYCTS
jgi:hypothetical protein